MATEHAAGAGLGWGFTAATAETAAGAAAGAAATEVAGEAASGPEAAAGCEAAGCFQARVKPPLFELLRCRQGQAG